MVEPKVIGKDEYRFLASLVWVFLFGGFLGGLVLGLSLGGDEVIQSSYWTQLLTVSGVAALPLVAIAVRLPRASGTTGWEKPARIAVFCAFPLVLAEIVLCLNRVAVTPKDGANPGDFFPIASGVGVGLILAAVAVGVAADVLDKIDTPSGE
jgi:hypothetical protein